MPINTNQCFNGYNYITVMIIIVIKRFEYEMLPSHSLLLYCRAKVDEYRVGC